MRVLPLRDLHRLLAGEPPARLNKLANSLFQNGHVVFLLKGEEVRLDLFASIKPKGPVPKDSRPSSDWEGGPL